MGKRSAARNKDVEEVNEKSDLRCVWGLFSALFNSCQVHASPYKFISNRRHAKTNVIDKSRKLGDELASIDEESPKSQNEKGNMSNIRATGSAKSVRNLILDDIYIDTHKNYQDIVKPQQLTHPDPDSFDHCPMKTHKAARKKTSQTEHHSFSNATPKNVNEEIVQQARMSVKAFIDQMFVDGKLTNNESMAFTDALEILSTTNKDLFIDLLSETNSHCEKTTAFSVKEIKRKLKHTFVDFRKEQNRFSNDAKTNEKPGKKLGLVSDRGSDISYLTENVRKKIDFSSERVYKRHMPARRKNLNASNLNMLDRIYYSPEHDERRDSQLYSARMRSTTYSYFSLPKERQRTCMSPLRANREVTSGDGYEEYDDTTERFSFETNCSLILNTHEKAHDIDHISATGNMRSNGEPHEIETKSICYSEVPSERNMIDAIASDSLSENETFTSTVDNSPSTPTSVNVLNMSETIKYQEEHQSPVSVLDQLIFRDDANNNSHKSHFSDRKRLQSRCLNFDQEGSIESSSEDQPISEQDYISHYVHLVLQASCLNWDQIMKIGPQSNYELIRASFFDEVDFLPSDRCFDPKLMFDHINEVLLEIHQSHFSFVKPKKSFVSLDKLVLDEIMRRGEEFYLIPRADEERRWDELVAKDVLNCKSWIDVQHEAEDIMIHISEDILEECFWDIVRGFCSS